MEAAISDRNKYQEQVSSPRFNCPQLEKTNEALKTYLKELKKLRKFVSEADEEKLGPEA